MVASAVTKRILAAFEAGELISICAWCSLVELDGEWVPASRSDLWPIEAGRSRSSAAARRAGACAARLATENFLLKEELAQRRGAPQIVGEDPTAEAGLVGAAPGGRHRHTTVLLEGESGTGKELFARALHALSPRADGPFVAINCAAIPENLLETELFGHEKGAFTGATQRKPGQVRAGASRHAVPRRDRRPAAGAAGEDPARARREAVRAGRRHRAAARRRAGGRRDEPDLKAAVAARQFREDLYFRLSVFPITIPPLRERPDDIPLLATLLHRASSAAT